MYNAPFYVEIFKFRLHFNWGTEKLQLVCFCIFEYADQFKSSSKFSIHQSWRDEQFFYGSSRLRS